MICSECDIVIQEGAGTIIIASETRPCTLYASPEVDILGVTDWDWSLFLGHAPRSNRGSQQILTGGFFRHSSKSMCALRGVALHNTGRVSPRERLTNEF